MTLRGLVLLLATLLGMGVTARLGLWQLDRAAEKTALQAAIKQQGERPPLDMAALARDLGQAQAQVHRRAVVAGTWLPEHVVHLDNRQMHGHPGFFVLMPLRLDDGSVLLVQRGWRARDFVERTRLAPLPSAAGQVRLSGRLARGPARLYQFADAQPGPIRQNLDLSAYARETGLALRPLMLLQTSAADDGLLRDWPEPTVDVHKNYGYAFQWFALCALILFLHVWFRILRPRRTHRA
jgi:surfeit locus 1 family protein